MTSLSASHDPTALDQYNKTFNGQIYEPNEQCQHYLNGSSYLCRVSLRVTRKILLAQDQSQCQNVQINVTFKN